MKQLKKEEIKLDEAKVFALEALLKSINIQNFNEPAQIRGEIHYWIEFWQKQIAYNKENLSG